MASTPILLHQNSAALITAEPLDDQAHQNSAASETAEPLEDQAHQNSVASETAKPLEDQAHQNSAASETAEPLEDQAHQNSAASETAEPLEDQAHQNSAASETAEPLEDQAHQNSAASETAEPLEDHVDNKSDHTADVIISSNHPTPKDWFRGKDLVHYQGFWYPESIISGIISVQKNFKSRPNQILLASYPKSGTTWLKALVVAITNKTLYENDSKNNNNNDATAAAATTTKHPHLAKNPHDYVPFLEFLYSPKNLNNNPSSDYDHPVFSSHLAYSSLPKQIQVDSDCKIVYIARNPKDLLTSFWHFANKMRGEELPPLALEVAYEMFCNGTSPYGSYWDNMLGYWNASLKFPERVLFLKYEEMKRDNPIHHVKRLAEFIGHPFSPEQEKAGMIDKIISMCSFETLSKAEVNKNGIHNNGLYAVKNEVFFRKGAVGDWQNHLTKEMADKLNDIGAEKFKGSGLAL